MKKKSKLLSAFLCLAVVFISFSGLSITASASGWMKYVKTAKLGKTYSDSVLSSDYNDTSYSSPGFPSEAYWDIYKFTLPKDGVLKIHLESEEKLYFRNTYYGSTGELGYYIFSGKNPDKVIWHDKESNLYNPQYSSARGRYYATQKIALSAGTYYFGSKQTLESSPYYLTLSMVGSGSSKQEVALKTATISSVKSAKKMFTIKVKKVTGAKGYQIQYKKNGKWSSLNTTSTTTAVTNLKKGVYTVRIRAYNKTNGKTTYGNWSKTKSVSVR